MCSGPSPDRLCISLILLVVAQLRPFATSTSSANNRSLSAAPNASAAAFEAGPWGEPDSLVLEGKCLVVCDPDERSTAGDREVWGEEARGSRKGKRAGVALRSGATQVAFSVTRSTNHEASGRANRTMVIYFDQILVNLGNHFDVERSAFVAPRRGVYSFIFYVVKVYNRQIIQVSLVLNGSPVVSGFAGDQDVSREAASNALLLRMEPGDRASLQLAAGNLVGGWKYSTFSGFLVFPL